MVDLADRHVVVTGASRGLGRVMALGLAAAGARVTAVALRESPQLRETLSSADKLGASDRFQSIVGDLRQWTDCLHVHEEAVRSFGAVEVLINNAGIPTWGPGEPFWRANIDDWLRMVHTNVDGIFLLTRSVTPVMVRNGFGRIVNVSTRFSTMVRKLYSPYGPSKAFVEASTRIWAEELAGTGVTANVLLPGGAVDTAADVNGVPTPGRTFLPASVMVAPAIWLASDASSAYTGLRLNAALWDESLPIAERVAKANESSGTEPRIM
jgi:NAD(P)-dependent dehydrogenase (short-subunit alcohol dehydrogenase family)